SRTFPLTSLSWSLSPWWNHGGDQTPPCATPSRLYTGRRVRRLEMFSPHSLSASPCEASLAPRAALPHLPPGRHKHKTQNEPILRPHPIVSVLYRETANPSERPARHPFTAPPGAANPRGIIQFSHHSVPEGKPTWH